MKTAIDEDQVFSGALRCIDDLVRRMNSNSELQQEFGMMKNGLKTESLLKENHGDSLSILENLRSLQKRGLYF